MSDKTERIIFGLTLASAACALLSIFVSETLGAAACLLWIVSRPRKIRLPTYVVPLCAFMIATVLSLVMSPEPSAGIAQINKFVLFPMGLLAVNFVTTPQRARLSYAVLLIVAAAGSSVAIGQFVLSYGKYVASGSLADDPTVLARVTGFMSHWMTFSGEQMLVWCAALPAVAMLGQRWIAALSVVGVGIILSFTRSVWLGAAAGFCAIAVTMPRRLLLMIVIPVVLAGAFSSGLIYHRLSLSMQPGFAPDTGRITLLKVGAQMIHDNPFFGVGPERVHTEFPRYVAVADLPTYYGHLENNYMQIAAERGLVCFAAFLWLILELYASLWRVLKTNDETTRIASLSAIAALTGFLVAGLFSYDFGDSEVLMLFLFLVSIPLGLSTSSLTTSSS